MIDAGWCIARSSASSAEDAILEIAGRLVARGRVRPSFGPACILREKHLPTGLPFDAPAVALPHVDASHVIASSVAVLTLDAPVAFREMGAPETVLDVSIVIVPAFATTETARELAELVAALQDRALREALAAAGDADELARVLGEALKGG
ncbi:PTS sugar transporter subunit IIA [Pendulispora brunnea]|uniref:PTS sugar transporter subunit IIA n=1 Tax=Pendulispora brunnea TaxID=2905690 RepID=A0ABZ2KPC0_9BACT